jgi:MoaA/NifB/PqqE/SkfB family radical SAM enzyme
VTPARHHVVLPGPPAGGSAALSDAARHLVEAARLTAESAAGCPVDVLMVRAGDRTLWRHRGGRLETVTGFDRGRVHVAMNPTFLLADPPPLAALETAAGRQGAFGCGDGGSEDLHALAFDPVRVTPDLVWSALSHLTCCAGDAALPWPDADGGLLPPGPAWVGRSPALQGVSGVRHPRLPEAPCYVNAAFREVLWAPQDRREVAGDPLQMARVLLAQREASRVPWIFNTLLCDVEHRLGTVEPTGYPPEVHLSLTGGCNIECRFCGYTHDEARFDLVTPEQVGRLDFLRHLRAFRLNSSLGEPTLNKHLPAIIEGVSGRHPHLVLNLFTNGVTLDRPGVQDALVGRVRWISASLNAATRESWKELCKVDLFDKVCGNLRSLHRAKREKRTLWPLVFGSMVLTRANLSELPAMPALCRELGVDRFTGFPYFAMGYTGEKLGADMTLEACREEYDALYWETLREAEAHAVSLEIPLPRELKRTDFGLEARPLHDFAGVETNEWTLGRFVGNLRFDQPPGAHCPFLWRQAAAGSLTRVHHAQQESHSLVPCLGPLCRVDLSGAAPFRFPDGAGFQRLWGNPVFEELRRGQHQPGRVPVCDACRGGDSRDPARFALLLRLVADFARQHGGTVPG